MKNLLALSASTAFLSGLLFIAGCSSDDNSNSGGGGGAATVPENAVLINTSPIAETTTTSAVTTGASLVSIFGVEATTVPTARDIINILLEKIHNRSQNSIAIVTGVDLSADFCPAGGTANGDEVETLTSYVANITFDACSDGFATITGTISINSTFSDSAGPYTDNLSGTLTVVLGSSSVGFNSFSFLQSGDDSTGAYTITAFTFAIDPSPGGGYLVQLTQPLIGNEFVSCELTGGQVLVTGASGSQARATVNPGGSVKIEFHSGDGNFVETDNSPILCLI